MQDSSSTYQGRGSLVKQIRTRLFFGMGLLIVVLVIHLSVSALTFVVQHNVSRGSLSLRDDINELQSAMVDQETGIRGYTATANSVFLEPFNSGRETYLSTLDHLHELLNNDNFANTQMVLPQVEMQADEWYQNYAQVQLTNVQNGHRTLAQVERTIQQGKQLFDRYRLAAVRLQEASQLDVERQQRWMDTLNIVATAISLLLSVLVILLLWRALTGFATALHSQLDILEETSNRLGEGNFNIRVPALESQELHQLGKTFNTMAEALKQQSTALKDRDVLESVLHLNTLLTSTLDFDTLVATFLDSALSMLHLQLAALYLYDEQKERLVLAGAQGFDFAELTQEFALGEGLLGSTALTRSPSYIRAPAPSEAGNFIAKTVMGKALPGSMYQLPLIQGKDLLGVLVFASLYSISEQARNILTVVSSNLSTVIGHTKAYEYIQAQTEELAAKNREQERMNAALRIQRNELRVLNATLEEANEARNQFLSTMTHELRTPLTAILGFSQIILRDLQYNQHHEQHSRSNVERIIKNGNHLLSLVNDTLDLVKIEAGHMNVNISTVHLSELIPAVIEEIRPLTGEKKVALQMHIAEGIDEIESDPGKLRQILLNLISNAIKFTEQGEVSVSATRQSPAGHEEEWIAITVKDTGIGIAPETQERIFDAFYQGDSSITRKYGGTGLGLSIVHQLTLLLGGTLELTSSPGQGSAFTVFLPPASASRHVEQKYDEFDQEQEDAEASLIMPLSNQDPSSPQTIKATGYAAD
ncbi:MAG: CHASE3 domain-containing protein [Ktedonobacteraceae bacterium]|nr:CHASE3 domain-containing protein [Ktedonobacteraceae bacterium]